ncbi:MAG: hypothetical protein JSS07_06360 [Proteobacteria bacterium]|nr:hypothetical protein [Pseudomonadota bacterium]
MLFLAANQLGPAYSSHSENYINQGLINHANAVNTSEQVCSIDEKEEFQKQLNLIAAEMDKRATNFHYGLGVGIGRMIGTRDDENPNIQETSIINQEPIEQLSTKNTREFFDAILAEFKSQGWPEKLAKEVDEAYSLLRQRIQAEMHQAKHLQKPLMVLMGEEHNTLNSAVINAMCLMITSQEMAVSAGVAPPTFSAKALLTEDFFYEFYQNLFKQNDAEAQFMSTYVTEQLAKELNIKKTSINLASCYTYTINSKLTPAECEAFYKSAMSKGACAYHPSLLLSISFHSSPTDIFTSLFMIRDKCMAQVAAGQSEPYVITIVGSNHIHELKKNKDLSNKYHILAINSLEPKKKHWIAESISNFNRNLIDFSKNFYKKLCSFFYRGFYIEKSRDEICLEKMQDYFKFALSAEVLQVRIPSLVAFQENCLEQSPTVGSRLSKDCLKPEMREQNNTALLYRFVKDVAHLGYQRHVASATSKEETLASKHPGL